MCVLGLGLLDCAPPSDRNALLLLLPPSHPSSRAGSSLTNDAFHIRSHYILQEDLRRCPRKACRKSFLISTSPLFTRFTGRIHHRRRIENVSFCEPQVLPSPFAFLILAQGGRLVTERRMVSDLYVFDLNTFTWEKTTPFPEDDVPAPRYFHSAETCRSPPLPLVSSTHLSFQGTINSSFLVEWEILPIPPTQRIFAF